MSLTDSMHIRVYDYLDDKLQTADDIDNLDTLLQNVQQQQELLIKQVCCKKRMIRYLAKISQLEEAKITLDNAQKASDEHAAIVRYKAEDFQQQQAQIDNTLMAITGSATSDDAVKKVESSMSKLRRLEVATEYMELLQEVDKLGYGF